MVAKSEISLEKNGVLIGMHWTPESHRNQKVSLNGIWSETKENRTKGGVSTKMVTSSKEICGVLLYTIQCIALERLANRHEPDGLRI